MDAPAAAFRTEAARSAAAPFYRYHGPSGARGGFRMNVPTPNASAASPRLRAVLTVLLVNAVPLIGIHRYGWSAANVLVLYWFENLLIAICTCIRLLVHRHLTRKKGYWRHTNRFGIEVNGEPVKTSTRPARSRLRSRTACSSPSS
jgi:hypothetical protein